jgi:hypothetical protein
METEILAYVGLDWADQQHVICCQAAGSASVETAVVQQRPEELQAWVAQRSCGCVSRKAWWPLPWSKAGGR